MELSLCLIFSYALPVTQCYKQSTVHRHDTNRIVLSTMTPCVVSKKNWRTKVVHDACIVRTAVCEKGRSNVEQWKKSN